MVLAGFFLVTVTPAFAADDPFDLDTAHWMSFDRYKEKTKNKANFNPAQTPDVETGKDIATPQPSVEKALDGSTAANITTPSMTPAIAAPTRPINIPVMPGVNKGYAVHVNSTEDEKPPVAQITDLETTPKIELPTKNWQSPKSHAALSAGHGDEDEEHQALDVRMSFLPNPQITPVPSPDYKSNHGRPPAGVVAAAKTEAKKADPAACAAIDAYKKRQLQALESDRQTLSDLQKAIAQLGLQKELSFMTGANGKMNQANSGEVTVDAPPSLADLQKN